MKVKVIAASMTALALAVAGWLTRDLWPTVFPADDARRLAATQVSHLDPGSPHEERTVGVGMSAAFVSEKGIGTTSRSVATWKPN